MTRIVDLTLPIQEHFRWAIERESSGDFAAGDQYRSTRFGMSVHAFTHMDAQSHILADGPTTDDIPLERVVGECAVLDLSEVPPNAPIETDRIAAAGGHIRPSDIVVLKTCWERTHSPATPEFWTEAPFMTRGASQWLLEREIRAIGFDFPQDYPIRLLLPGQAGERRPFDEHVTHDILLRNGVTMIEYLSNTAALAGPRTFLCALPLKIPGSDGAPTRVIAIEEF
jgi:kynurenine formamidase